MYSYVLALDTGEWSASWCDWLLYSWGKIPIYTRQKLGWAPEFQTCGKKEIPYIFQESNCSLLLAATYFTDSYHVSFLFAVNVVFFSPFNCKVDTLPAEQLLSKVWKDEFQVLLINCFHATHEASSSEGFTLPFTIYFVIWEDLWRNVVHLHCTVKANYSWLFEKKK
jgi:hypothetical protein